MRHFDLEKAETDMDKRNALASLFLFRGSDFDLLDEKYKIMERCKETDFSDGELIVSAGYSGGLPILLCGKARIVSGDSDRSAVLKYVREGECFGAATIFSDDASHSTKVRSVGNSTVAALPYELLCEILHLEPKCSFEYISFLSEKIAFLNKKITAFTAGSAEAKLAVYLLELPRDAGGTAVLDISLSALSSQLGIGRASLYRALDSFENSGIISKQSKSVTLLQPEMLKSMIQ